MTDYLSALLGGMLIGLSATLLLLFNGRIAGVSGIVAGLLRRPSRALQENALFALGLLLGPPLYWLVFSVWPLSRIEASMPLLLLAGLLVGFGTRLGSGCTSGHGVCGLARLSLRSLVAVLIFLSCAMLTVFLQRLGGLP